MATQSQLLLSPSLPLCPPAPRRKLYFQTRCLEDPHRLNDMAPKHLDGMYTEQAGVSPSGQQVPWQGLGSRARREGLLLRSKKRHSAKSFHCDKGLCIPRHHLLEETVLGNKSIYSNFCLALDLILKGNWAAGVRDNLVLLKTAPNSPFPPHLTGDRGCIPSPQYK